MFPAGWEREIMNFEDDDRNRLNERLHGRESRHSRDSHPPVSVDDLEDAKAKNLWAADSSPALDEEEMAMLGRIKVDLDTSLEKAFSWAMWGFLFVGLFCLKEGTVGGKRHAPSPVMMSLVPYCIGFALIAFALRRGTDNYYVLDVRSRKVLYHFRFLTWEQIDRAFGFEDIRKLEMVIETRHSKHSSWEEFQLQLHRSVGQIVPFSDWEKERSSIQDRGEKMARLFGKKLVIQDNSVGSVTKNTGSAVWFHLGGMAITEHVFAVSLGLLFALVVVGIVLVGVLR